MKNQIRVRRKATSAAPNPQHESAQPGRTARPSDSKPIAFQFTAQTGAVVATLQTTTRVHRLLVKAAAEQGVSVPEWIEQAVLEKSLQIEQGRPATRQEPTHAALDNGDFVVGSIRGKRVSSQQMQALENATSKVCALLHLLGEEHSRLLEETYVDGVGGAHCWGVVQLAIDASEHLESAFNSLKGGEGRGR